MYVTNRRVESNFSLFVIAEMSANHSHSPDRALAIVNAAAGAQARPEALDWYLQITGYTEKEFYEILKAQRQDKAKLLP